MDQNPTVTRNVILADETTFEYLMDDIAEGMVEEDEAREDLDWLLQQHLDVLDWDGEKIGAARNLRMTDRGIEATVTVRREYADDDFYLDACEVGDETVVFVGVD